MGTSSSPEFSLDESPRTGDAAAQADSQSAKTPAAVSAEDAHQQAYQDNHPRTAAEASTKVSEEIARRSGFEGDSAPLGDPNAPQGTGPENDFSRPENRPAPIGKIRMSEFESGPDHEQ